MLTAKDLCKRFKLELDQIGYLYAKRVLPEGVSVGGKIRFREQDIRKFEKYLLARNHCRDRGVDPDGVNGPAPPVYSTAGKPRFDPRLVVANEREAERQKRSRTLASGSVPIGEQPSVTMPEVNTKTKAAE